MEMNKLSEKKEKDLTQELVNLLREQFNLRMHAFNKKKKQTHMLKKVRRNIARIKTLLTKKVVCI